mmetsp:Transcript_13577/g.31847  ORF Transcript_13577/g.31847 Transcript_13577/m.31847 type:complete len:562 (+) Transcript_13577:100-1785(+)
MVNSRVEVDVIIPVYNASSTVKEAVLSALNQRIPSSQRSPLLKKFLQKYSILVTVCCYDDGSTDGSLGILRELEIIQSKRDEAITGRPRTISTELIPSRLMVESSKDGEGRGAGYARNRAIEMNNISLDDAASSEGAKSDETDDTIEKIGNLKFLCLLDSDDVMHKHRIIEQVLYMICIVDNETRNRTLLGSTFDRDPPDSTWHYSNWANNLTDERLMLERYREITILQPTWFMPLSVWSRIGGYIEAPRPGGSDTILDICSKMNSSGSSSFGKSCLIHPEFETTSSLRLAEDLRFFHSHLESNGCLRLHRTSLATTEKRILPLVTYRHTGNDQSQSFRTSRKLLLQLRVLAFQKNVLRANSSWNEGGRYFVIWGCGRDGKDFFKALDEDLKERVYCFVDVDVKKLNVGYYVYTKAQRTKIKQTQDTAILCMRKKNQKGTSRKIPIVHFSFLIPGQKEQEIVRSEWMHNYTIGNKSIIGRIDKSKGGIALRSPGGSQPKKKQKLASVGTPTHILQDRGLDRKLLSRIPVVVCVAMYRTNGVLENNVRRIGRKEGETLWHFS